MIELPLKPLLNERRNKRPRRAPPQLPLRQPARPNQCNLARKDIKSACCNAVRAIIIAIRPLINLLGDKKNFPKKGDTVKVRYKGKYSALVLDRFLTKL